MKGVTPKHDDVALPWRHSRFLEWRFHTPRGEDNVLEISASGSELA